MNKKSKNNTLVLIPVYNEAKVLGSVIKNIRERGFTNIVVVDDGSEDRTSIVAQRKGVFLLKH